MDVQVKLSLQGGQIWDFVCDEDDPIVFGLVSSLPGAGMGGQGTSESIIQVQTGSGRLYFTRSSLVAVEISPVINVAVEQRSHRVAVPSAGFSGGMAAPSPFVSAPAILPGDLHRSLLEYAFGQHDTKSLGPDNVIRLELGPCRKDVETALLDCLEKTRPAFGLEKDRTFDLEFELFALGNAQTLPAPSRLSDILGFVYHFHKSPKAFTGGGVRLFDGQIKHGMIRASDTFRDMEIKDNALLMFPASVICAALPVYCPTKDFADGLFAIRGALKEKAA